MQTVLWSFMTYVILGSGLFVAVLTFSGIRCLERIAAKFCSIAIGCGGDAHKRTFIIRVPMVFMKVAALAFLAETWALSNLKARRTEMTSLHNLGGIIELKANVLRHQRNWWISLASILLWCVVWRFNGLIKRLRKEIDFLKTCPELQ